MFEKICDFYPVLSFVLSRKIKKDESYEYLEEVVSSKISGITLTFFALL